jgi:acylphosphatase
VAGPGTLRRSVALRVRGVVQGVGFRPAVWQAATALGLDGDVRNDGEGMLIRAAGAPHAIEALLARLRSPIGARGPSATRSRPARNAGRASRSWRRCRTTGCAPRWRASRCAAIARRSIAIRRTGASTPRPSPARPAGRGFRSAVRKAKRRCGVRSRYCAARTSWR